MAKKHRSHKTKPKKTQSGKRHPHLPASSKAVPKTWYSGLGVSSQADSETIRQRYLELVRRFPPETHPEDFAEIRQAYDVLNDVKARRRYDRERFYGTTLPKLRALIEEEVDQGHGETVARLLKEAVDIEPNAEEMLKLGGVYQALGQTREAEKWYQQAEDVCENAEAKVSILVSKAHLSESDPAIVAALHEVAEKYPNVSPVKMAVEFLVHYEALGEIDKGMAYFRKLIPRRKYLTAADFAVYIHWMELLAELELPDELRDLFAKRVKPAAERASHGPHRQAIAQWLVSYLDDSVPSKIPDGKLQTAWKLRTMVVDLLRTVDPDDPDIQKGWREYVTISVTLRQAERLMADERVPTSVLTRVMEKVFGDLSVIAEVLEERPGSPRALPESEAIVLIKRTYPRVYSLFEGILPSPFAVDRHVDPIE